MTNKQQKISVHSHDCKAFVDEIKLLANMLENQKLSNADVRAINCKICHDINNEITACMKLSGVKDYDDYEIISRGATSLCYLSKNDAQQKTILKVFEPESFPLTLITPYSDIEYDTVVSYNWIDCNKADAEQEYAFLKRFVRFILQEELITTLQSNANHNEQNLFIVPKLALTTKGFAFISPYFFGDTLKERFQKYAETTTSTTEGMICDSVRAVRQSAEYIRDVCHGKNIYHGDIKPSNFFDIKDGDSHLIKNIDFDTLVAFNENSFCVYRNWDVAATTPLFYYVDTARVNRNQDFDKIKEYDISALSRMLMYAIICIYGEEENLYNAFNSDSTHFNWIDFFFKSSDVGERLFNDICIAGSTRDGDYSEKIELSGLFIFEKIRSLLMRCSEKVKDTAMIVDAQEFIDCSLLIEELFKHNRGDFSMPSDTGREQLFILNGVIRHLNLLYIDTENNRNNKKITANYHKLVGLRPSCDWVQYVIEKNYYKQENEDYDKIDRHLIPDIDLGDGKPLAYKFDNKSHPTSASPLEQALDKVGNKSLFLTAEGGQGKTTMLRSFWLDFLSGNHDIACLYVDLKMLKGRENESIDNYVAKEYKCNVRSEIRPILLLDNPNESNVHYRKGIDDGKCLIVKECKEYIDDKIQIIIGSRSDAITIMQKKDDGDENTTPKPVDLVTNSEFDVDEMQYATVCKLRDNQVEHCVKAMFVTVKDKQPMIDLLRNNMMLHIYTNLQFYGIELRKEDMMAGILLDRYFEICFRTRYVRSCIMSIGLSDRELYNKISDIGNRPLDENEGEIYKASLQYNKIVNYLIDNCLNSNITTKLPESIYVSAFENLSILVKDHDDTHYVWVNEVYQEYFQALKIVAILERTHQIAFNRAKKMDIRLDGISAKNLEEEIEKLIKLLEDETTEEEDETNNWKKEDEIMFVEVDLNTADVAVLPYCYIKKTNAIQYSGELLNKNEEYFEEIIDAVSTIKNEELSNIYKEVYIMINDCNKLRYFMPHAQSLVMAIVAVSLLSGKGIPNNIIEIDDSAFSYMSVPESIIIPNNVRFINPEAFAYCSNLKKITIGTCVEIIHFRAFERCHNLECIQVENGNAKFFSKDNCLIDRSSGELILGCKNSIIPADGSVTSIDYCAFAGCSNLINITIPKSVTSIGRETFADCSNLVDIKIPYDVTSIGVGAFSGCNKLINVENGVWYVDRWAIDCDANVAIVGLRSNTVGIGEYALRCSNMIRLEIPASVNYIDKWAFAGMNNNLECIQVENGNAKFFSKDNCLIDRSSGELILGCKNSIIPADGSVMSIGCYAFACCSDLTDVTIPNSVTNIGRETFADCNSLVRIVFDGTIEQWQQIYCHLGLISQESHKVTVQCIDGDIEI